MAETNLDISSDESASLNVLDTHLVASHGVARQVFELLRGSVEGAGFEIVRIRYGLHDGQTLQLMAERPDGSISISECEELSRIISAVLDVEDPISGEYNLEISSPGIDRPLTRPKDFERWQGFEAKVELAEAVSGRKRFRGLLHGVEDGEILLECEVQGFSEPQVLGLPFQQVSEAKLVMSDDLMREGLKRQGGVDDDPEAPSDGE